MLTAMLLLACTGAQTAPEAAPVATPVATAEPTTLPSGSRGGGATTVANPTEGAPASTDEIRGLLLAHHDEDLPDRATLEKHEGALESLAWLARNDDTLVVRERALLLLAQWPSDPTASAVCAEVLASEAPAGARAAAATCLGNQALSTDEALLKQVVGALRDPDGRVGSAAALALAGVPAARPELQAASTDTTLPADTQEAAARALRYR